MTENIMIIDRFWPGLSEPQNIRSVTLRRPMTADPNRTRSLSQGALNYSGVARALPRRPGLPGLEQVVLAPGRSTNASRSIGRAESPARRLRFSAGARAAIISG
ncbi:MAG: hypothetical protein ACRDK8_15160, partial [Solirubrobacteraceae bacterium]